MKHLLTIILLIAICDIKAQSFDCLLFGQTHDQIKKAYTDAGQKELSIIKTGDGYCALFSSVRRGFVGVAYEFVADACVVVWFYFNHKHAQYVKDELDKHIHKIKKNLWRDDKNIVIFGRFKDDLDYLRYSR